MPPNKQKYIIEQVTREREKKEKKLNVIKWNGNEWTTTTTVIATAIK